MQTIAHVARKDEGVVPENPRIEMELPNLVKLVARPVKPTCQFGERTNLEFRWEVFNITNTPLFGQPNSNFSSGATGTITTLSGDPRVMQFARG